ncbi:low molecular weight protein-tyrosine-phosphatase [uncultured Lutibacter sp.]|uniref:low molecular weight protein-tyrosine-phosphatase n=1 Tax=uncultured Lutibacter sp. TaxID=437739 RepID=UPI00262A55AB|nr:low molecular weight protein-tyrosine-phosphatase [uncultured Lutibacter sp.]
MTKILMVCLGNICRSPLAEGILKSKVFGFKTTIDSAGTGDYHTGTKPDIRSINIAKINNIDITDQSARQFVIEDFDKFDLIYAMDNSNYENIVRLARNENDKSKVKLILNEVFPGENLDVPDPYTGGSFGFKNVYMMLDEACEVIAKKINQNG